MNDTDIKAQRRLCQTVGDLIDRVRVSDLPAALSDQTTRELEDMLRRIVGYQRPEPHAQSRQTDTIFWQLDEAVDPSDLMEFSPIMGTLNPVSPGFKVFRVEDHIEGHGIIPERFIGAPSTVHGGYVAAILDELMGMLGFIHGGGAYTGTMTVRYQQPTPAGKPLHGHAHVTSRDGRKIYCTSELRYEGTVTASAEAVFIRPRPAVSEKPEQLQR